jgi:hypothetical protein
MTGNAETQQMRIENLKARIGRSEYRVDPDAVAEAIVRRLLAARSDLQRALDGPSGGALSSGDVLEAG